MRRKERLDLRLQAFLEKFPRLEVRRIRHRDVIRAVLFAPEEDHLPLARDILGKDLHRILVDLHRPEVHAANPERVRDQVIEIIRFHDLLGNKHVE